MAIFGHNSTGNGTDTLSGQYGYNVGPAEEIVCPGSGEQTVASIEVYAKSNGGTAGYIRCAIYEIIDAFTITKMCEWSGKILVDSTTASWIGGAQGITTTTALTGGNSYYLVVTCSSSDVKVGITSSTTGMKYSAVAQYTDGYPETADQGSAYSEVFCIRATVGAAVTNVVLNII